MVLCQRGAAAAARRADRGARPPPPMGGAGAARAGYATSARRDDRRRPARPRAGRVGGRPHGRAAPRPRSTRAARRATVSRPTCCATSSASPPRVDVGRRRLRSSASSDPPIRCARSEGGPADAVASFDDRPIARCRPSCSSGRCACAAGRCTQRNGAPHPGVAPVLCVAPAAASARASRCTTSSAGSCRPRTARRDDARRSAPSTSAHAAQGSRAVYDAGIAYLPTAYDDVADFDPASITSLLPETSPAVRALRAERRCALLSTSSTSTTAPRKAASAASRSTAAPSCTTRGRSSTTCGGTTRSSTGRSTGTSWSTSGTSRASTRASARSTLSMGEAVCRAVGLVFAWVSSVAVHAVRGGARDPRDPRTHPAAVR